MIETSMIKMSQQKKHNDLGPNLIIQKVAQPINKCNKWQQNSQLLKSFQNHQQLKALITVKINKQITRNYKLSYQIRFKQRMRNNTSKKLMLYTTGILVAYLCSSLITERLYSTKYPHIKPNKDGSVKYDKFNFPSILVWCACLFCAIYGEIKSRFIDKKPSPISYREQATLGALFTLNYLPANYALLYMPYHIQVIAKNCRYIFVIIVGVFLSRVKKGEKLRLGMNKVFIGVLITTGALIFTLFKAESKAHKEQKYENQWIGYVMILVSIISDAFFSDSQAYSKVTFHPTANHLFTAANKWAFLFVFVNAIVQNQLIPSVNFLINHPTAIIDLFGVCILQLIGQICIYLVVANFKQHIYPLISTVRKIFTILLSILVFGHPMTIHQWFAMVLVFGGMAYEFVDEVNSHEKQDKAKKDQNLEVVDEGNTPQSQEIEDAKTD